MRPLSACVACRDRRKKCDRPRQGTSCTFCIKRGLICAVESPKSPKAVGDGYDPLVNPRGDSALPISPASIMPDRELCQELVGLYFRYIHITFHNLFHRPSFEAAVRDGTVPRILLFGVFSLAARFSSHPYFAKIDPQERGRPYAKEVERLLDLHKTCLTTVQACVILGGIQVVEMDPATESVYYTIACRLAMILDLPNAPTKSRIEQEVNLRVWWSVVTTDTWCSSALGLPRAIQPNYNLQMPMDELTFAHLAPEEPPLYDQGVATPSPPSGQASQSLVAQMIRLNRILYDINTLNTRATSDVLETSYIQETVGQLSLALDCWERDLPDSMQYNHNNLSYWASQGCGSFLVVLHINFNHLGQLLFYRFLHHNLASDDFPSTLTAAYAEKCKTYAANLCELIYEANRSPDTEVMYPLVGHVLVIASTVHLYTLLFSADDGEIETAKSRLQKNFEMITSLQKYWFSLEASFSRLGAFHKACLESKDRSFRLDRWMLGFLLEFAHPVKERVTEADDQSRELRSLVKT